MLHDGLCELECLEASGADGKRTDGGLRVGGLER